MKKILKYVFITSTVLFCSLPGNSQSKRIKNLSKEYLSVAHSEVDNKYLPITKWENIDKNWKEFINEVEKITNFKIVETKNESDYDILIFFGKKKDYFDYTNNKTYKIITGKSKNYRKKVSNHKGQLVKASFSLDVNKTYHYQKGKVYLQKYFLESLGLEAESENDFSLYYKGYKNNGAWFNKNDRRILKIHYSNEIKPDMTIEETRLVLKNSFDFKKLFKEKL